MNYRKYVKEVESILHKNDIDTDQLKQNNDNYSRWIQDSYEDGQTPNAAAEDILMELSITS